MSERSDKPEIRIEVATLEPLLLTSSEVQRLIGISKTKVWELIQRGHLPAKRLGGRTMVKLDDLKAFVDALPAWSRNDGEAEAEEA